MSIKQCENEILEFAKNLWEKEDRPVTDKKLKEFVRDMARRAKRLRFEDDTLSFEESLEKAAEQFKEDAKLIAQAKRKQAYLTVLKSNERLDQLENADFSVKRAQAFYDGTVSAAASSNDSMTNLQGATFRRLIGGVDGMQTKLMQAGLLEKFHSNNIELDLAKALRGEDVEDPDIKKMADIIQESQELARQIQNKLGANIGKLRDFIASQVHDPLKLLRTADRWDEHIRNLARLRGNFEGKLDMAFERWFNFMMPLLDADKTFSDIDPTDEARRGFMRAVFDDVRLKMRKPTDFAEDQSGTFKRGVSFAARISGERKIFLKDADSWIKWNRQYGRGNLQRSILQDFERASKNIGILKKFGPDAQRTHERIKTALLANNRDVKGIKSKVQGIENIWRNLNGTTNSPVSLKGARISANIRALVSMAKLGLVTFRSLDDTVAMAATLRFNGVGFLDSWFKTLSNLKNIFREDKDLKDVHALIGSGAESMMGSINRFSINNGTGGLVTQIEQIFYNLNLLKSWDHVNREGASTILSRHLAQLKDKSWENLPAHMKTSLGLYSIFDKEWEAIRKSEPTKDLKGRQYMTPDVVRSATKEDIASLLDKPADQVKPSEREAALDKIEDSMMMYFHDTANHSILHPSATSKSWIIRGTPSGTVLGEALRFMAQFKMYSLEFSRSILGRSLFAAPTPFAAVKNLAELMVGMVTLNYISQSAINVLQNRTPVNPFAIQGTANKIKFWSEMMIPGFGLWGDFIGGEYNQYGHSVLASIAGPVLSQTNDIGRLMANLKDTKFKSAGKGASELIKNNLPFHNLWFANAAMKFLFGNAIQNRTDPGAFLRARRRLLNEGQSPLINTPF